MRWDIHFDLVHAFLTFPNILLWAGNGKGGGLPLHTPPEFSLSLKLRLTDLAS